LEPTERFGGGGMYHPDPAALTAIRLGIASNVRGWKAVKRACPEIEGDTLRRAPAGFDPAHPFIDDLKRKDLYTLNSFTMDEVCGPDFLDRYVEAAESTAPLLAFMSKALGWRW
jgi:uncharacterized protein (TIGR02453 family)